VTVFYEYDAMNRKKRQYDELTNSQHWEYDKTVGRPQLSWTVIKAC